MVKHIPLTAEQKSSFAEIMVQGNTLLNYWSDKFLGARKRKRFRELALKNAFNPLDHGATTEEVSQYVQDRKKFVDVLALEEPMLHGYARLINKTARKMIRRADTKALDVEDLESEGYFAMRDAMFGYSNTANKFMTYFVRVLKLRMATVIDKTNPFSGVSESQRLLRRYRQEVEKANGPVTFDEIVEKMGLTRQQARALVQAQVKQIPVSQLTATEMDGDGYADYCELGETINRIIPSLNPDLDWEHLMATVELSHFERAAITYALDNGEYGWKSSFAREYRDEETGEQYSRMAACYALKRAWEKISPILKLAA